MTRPGAFLSSVAVLALVGGLAGDATAGKPTKPGKPGGGPKPATQLCVLSGDATGGGDVGINVTTYGNLEMTVAEGTNLATVLSAGAYGGIGRVLKARNSRLDFGFNDDGEACRMSVSSDGPPPIFDPEVCRYHLILAYGLFDRKADLVVFEGPPDAEALLYDLQEDLNEDGFLDPVGTGYADLDVQFLE